MYAGMVQAAQDAADAAAEAAAEAAALSAAQTAANSAATDAAAAATAANDALAGLAEKAAQDQASYAQAVAAASRAQAASQAAAAANQAAMLASTSTQAELQQGIAEAEKAKAESAQTDAERYAGMVNAAYQQHLDDVAAEAEAAALKAAQDAANAASTAAQNALTAATEALAGLLEKAEHDPNSYTQAVLAQGRAQAAAQAAAAAAMQADAADNSTDAQGHQATAEAEQAKAESAQADAEMYAGMVNDAYMQYMAEQADEQEKIALARTAAEAASTAASAAAGEADTAFMAIDGFSEHDAVNHALARSANAAAQAAKADAAAALADAMSATSSVAAQAAQSAAEAAQARAESAQTDAEKYAGMVQMAYDDYMAEEQRKMDVAEAQSEAATAAGEARMAADDAATEAAGGVALDDPVTIRLVQEAEAAAVAAEAAAMAASETDDLEEARKQRDIAQGKQTEAENAKMAAVSASNEAVRHAGINDPTEAIAIVAARRDAAEAARDAQNSADAAQDAADAAEMADPGSQEAMDAQDAADAAQEAADAAMQASQDAMDADNQADAEAAKDTAEEKEGEANTQLTVAETARNTAIANSRILANAKTVALAGAIKDAKDAADAAKTAADKAVMDAEGAVARARAARTDVTSAEAELEKAKAAQTAAEKAVADAAAAEQAVNDAMTTLEVGTAERDAADAEMAANGAKTDAETAGTAAMTAAGTHVLSLFKAANGDHVMDLESTTTTDEKADHVASVGTAIATAATATGADRAGSGTVATAAWPGDIAADPDASPPTEAVPGMLSVSVSPGGTAIPFELRASRDATDLNNDGDTTDDGEAAIIQTAMEIDGLGVFRGFDIWEDDGNDPTTDGDLHTDDAARVIAFTNKTQDDPPVAAAAAVPAVNLDNIEVVSAQVDELGTKSGNNYVGAKYDHDASDTTDPIEGTLICHNAAECSVSMVGDTLTVTGYRFTGSQEAKDEVTAMTAEQQATANNDYLVFGLWLDESNDGTTDTFGAFAVGGAGYAGSVADVVTGTAIYTGHAAGAHHKTGEGVNWFHGDARLTANFGAIDTDAERGTTPPADTTPGTISGEISNIRVNGGPALSDSIVLRQATLTTDTATFNGNARMGAGEIQPDDTVEYPFNGTWSGSFYGANPAVEDDASTTDVDESMPARAPDAAAGTFGVTMTDDMDTTDTADDVTESFVGAFGAHRPKDQ